MTVTGSTDAIYKGFQLITQKLEEVMERNQNEYGVSGWQASFDEPSDVLCAHVSPFIQHLRVPLFYL